MPTNPTISIAAVRRMLAAGTWRVLDELGPARDYRIATTSIDEPTAHTHTRTRERAEEIAAAHNALPALLDVAEAAQALQLGVPMDPKERADKLDALRKALASVTP